MIKTTTSFFYFGKTEFIWEAVMCDARYFIKLFWLLSCIVKLKFKNIWLGEAMSEKQTDPPAPNPPPPAPEQPSGIAISMQLQQKENNSKQSKKWFKIWLFLSSQQHRPPKKLSLRKRMMILLS